MLYLVTDPTEFAPAQNRECDVPRCTRSYADGSECPTHGKFGRIKAKIAGLKLRRDLSLSLYALTLDERRLGEHKACSKMLAIYLRAQSMLDGGRKRTARRFVEGA